MPKRLVLLLVLSLVLPGIASAQVFNQSQIINSPYGSNGFVVSTTSGVGGKLQATTTPYFASFFAGTANVQTNLFLRALSGGSLALNPSGQVYSTATTTASCAGTASCSTFTIFGNSPVTITGSSAGSSFPFSADTNFGQQVYSTSTPTLWFKSGLFASSTSVFDNASSTAATVFGNLWLPSLTSGALNVDSAGLVYKAATSTVGTGLLYTPSTKTISNAGVTAVAATYPLSVTGSTGSVTFSTVATSTFATSTPSSGGWGFTLSNNVFTLTIPSAGASTPFGLLTAADWSTFNGKLSAALTSIGPVGQTTVGPVVTIATSTTGTDFAVTGSGATLTFNLPVASASNTGKLSATDWSTFNGKQAAGNYITALTGDVTASGPGSVAATIAANAVTYAKFQQVAANSLVGNPTSATANAQAVATSTLFGTCAGGQVVGWSNVLSGLGCVATSSGSTAAAGSTGQIQFNTSNAFNADSNLFWNNAVKRLGISTTTPDAGVTIATSTFTTSGYIFSVEPPSYAVASSVTTTFSTAGTFTYTIPAGATSFTVQVYGAGGGGAAGGSTNGGGGGGSSAFGSVTTGTVAGGGGGAGNCNTGGCNNIAGGGGGFAQTVYAATSTGDIWTLVVGQGGRSSISGSGVGGTGFKAGGAATAGNTGGGGGGGSTAAGSNGASGAGAAGGAACGGGGGGSGQSGATAGGNNGDGTGGAAAGNNPGGPGGGGGGTTNNQGAGGAGKGCVGTTLGYGGGGGAVTGSGGGGGAVTGSGANGGNGTTANPGGAGGAGAAVAGMGNNIYGVGGSGSSGNGTDGAVLITVTFSAMYQNQAPFLVISSTATTSTASNATTTATTTPTFGIGTTSPAATFSVQGFAGVAVKMIAGFIGVTKYIFEELDQFGHLLTGGPTPVVSACGSSPAATIVGNDRNFRITVGGTLATSCTVTFANTYPNPPVCTIGQETGTALALVASSTRSALVISGGTFTNDWVVGHCEGYQ